MPLDILTGEITTPSRDEVRDGWIRSYRLRNPDADVGPDSEPWIDGATAADQMMVIYNDAANIGAACTSRNKTGDAVDEDLAARGLTRLPAAGASGYVEIGTNPAGTNLFFGDLIEDQNTGAQYQCISAGHYDDEDDVPVQGLDTGASTNKDAGSVLQWVSPRPGCETNCTVVAQSDGSGLSGGRAEETDAEALARIRDWNANQPAAGNKAAYELALKEIPGLRVEQGFTYPATKGPGTIGITFTMPPASAGSSRIPNAAQLAAALAYLAGRYPEDDGQFMVALVEQSRDVCLTVEWAPGVAAWTDAAPWPDYFEVAPGAGSGAIRVQAVTDSTHFILEAANADYTTCGDPAVGNVLGCYDSDTGVFRRKEIQSVTGTGPWTIVCETANNASDVTFAPAVNQRVCPWSDSLDDVAAKALEFFETLGPGEQQAVFTDAGLRQKRSPAAPASWPHNITSARMLRVLLDLEALSDCDVEEGEGDTTVGTPGALSYLLALNDLTVYAA